VPLALATGPWATRIVGVDWLLNRPAYTFLVLDGSGKRCAGVTSTPRSASAGPIRGCGCWTVWPGPPPATASPRASVTTSTGGVALADRDFEQTG
jgi:hypothetical protein